VVLAFRYNPLAPVILALFVYAVLSWFLMVLPFKRRFVVDTSRRGRALFWILVGVALALNWVYVAWAQMYKVPLEV
jgi:hypothetical protein